MFKVRHPIDILAFCSTIPLVQKSSKSVSLPEILYSVSPTSLSERLTMLRRDITTHFIDFVLIQPLSIAQAQSTDALLPSVEHKLELFPSPPSSASSRLDNLSEILHFLNTHLFAAIPPLQRPAFLKSFSKPLTSGILNHLLIPALPNSLSGLPKYLELLSRAVKFESEDLTRILLCPDSAVDISPENEIKSWADGIVSHYQRKRRVDILDQARRMFTDLSSDWHLTFQVEWSVSSTTSVPTTDVPAPPQPNAPSSSADHPPTNGTTGLAKEPDVEPVDDQGWGFDDVDDGAGGVDAEANEPPIENGLSSLAAQDAHTVNEVDDDAWGWNDADDPEPTPVPKPEVTRNGDAESSAGVDDPQWDAWGDAPPSPPTRKVVPKPATKLERFSSKGKQGPQPPKIVTQAPISENVPLDPGYVTTPASSTSLSSSWSDATSQQFHSIPPTPASVTVQTKPPKEFYSVSSGMQDILELVEAIMLESSQFSRSTLLVAYLPAPNSGSSASSASGSTPGSVILNTVPSILDLFRALYPMTLHLSLGTGGDSQKGSVKAAASESSAKKAIQFSNDCLYLEERIRELLPTPPLKSSNTSSTMPADVWTIDGGLHGKMEDASKRLRGYGESWFAKTIVCGLLLLFQSSRVFSILAFPARKASWMILTRSWMSQRASRTRTIRIGLTRAKKR